MIAGIAISSGTNASSEPNTKREHEQRADAAEQRLDEHAGPVAAARASPRARRSPTGGPARRRSSRPAAGAQALLGLRVVAEGLVGIGRGVGDDERRAPVLGDEAAVARGAVAGHARPGQRPRDALLDLRARRRGARRTVCPAGTVTTGISGALLPPVPAVVLRDLQVRLPALAAGHRELLVHRLGRRAGGRDADERDQQPEGDDQAAVGEGPAGESFHEIVCITNDCRACRIWRAT